MGRSDDEGYWDPVSISEVSRLLGVPASSLRYYEDEGLISPLHDSKSGYRSYTLGDLVELEDVMFYRSIGIPVKEIGSLMNSPIEDTVSAVDAAISAATIQIQSLTATLERLSMFNQRVRTYYMVRARGSRIVETPDIGALYSFGMKDRDSLKVYLEDMASSYGIFIEDARHPTTYTDCAVKPTLANDTAEVWNAQRARRYYECLLRTDYNEGGINNSIEHVEAMASQGLAAGCLASRFLTFEYSKEDGKRYDYYLAWIEIVE